MWFNIKLIITSKGPKEPIKNYLMAQHVNLRILRMKMSTDLPNQ